MLNYNLAECMYKNIKQEWYWCLHDENQYQEQANRLRHQANSEQKVTHLDEPT